MKVKLMLVLGGILLLCVGTLVASPLPGQSLNGQQLVFTPSSCAGDFGGGTGVCNIFEEPDNPEQQDFNLGTPNVGTGLVSIFDPNGTLSDSLLFYLATDGNVHALFQSDTFAQGGGAPTFEDANGNWCWLCGDNNNLYMGVSPPENPTVPEPASLILLGSGLLGLASRARKYLNK